MNKIEADLLAFGKEFISIDEAINAIANYTKSSISDMAKWLIMKKIHKVNVGIQSYCLDLDEFELSTEEPYYEGYYQIDLILCDYRENGCFLAELDQLSPDDCHEYGWIRSEFDSFIKKHLPDWTPEPKKEPPKQQVNNQIPHTTADQLAFIFDTTRPEHAPDLAMAIRLWLELYGGEKPTTKSHSAASDHFFRRNPLAENAKNRIKEVCSPQSIWKASRKDAYQQAIDDFTAQQQNKK